MNLLEAALKSEEEDATRTRRLLRLPLADPGALTGDVPKLAAVGEPRYWGELERAADDETAAGDEYDTAKGGRGDSLLADVDATVVPSVTVAVAALCSSSSRMNLLSNTGGRTGMSSMSDSAGLLATAGAAAAARLRLPPAAT